MNLIPKEKLDEFDDYIEKYHANALESNNSVLPLWRAMSSYDYKLDDDVKKETIVKLRKEMSDKIEGLDKERKEIVKHISQFFILD